MVVYSTNMMAVYDWAYTPILVLMTNTTPAKQMLTLMTLDEYGTHNANDIRHIHNSHKARKFHSSYNARPQHTTPKHLLYLEQLLLTLMTKAIPSRALYRCHHY